MAWSRMATRKPLRGFRHHARASLPDLMLSAGVAELVDALDLGSSDESCGGSSPSARTKRSIQAFASESSENLSPDLGTGLAAHRRQGCSPRADHYGQVRNPSGRTNEKKIGRHAGHRNPVAGTEARISDQRS